jgi:hypothetical protein
VIGYLIFCWPCIIMYHNNATNLTFRNRASLHIVRAHRYHPNTPFYIFFQQIYEINIFKMLHNLCSFLFKMSFIS